MSTYTGGQNGCAEAILQSMEELFMDAGRTVDAAGLTQSLMSNPNRAGFQIDQGAGNKRSARLKYMQRSTQTMSEEKTCEGTDNPLYTEEEVAIDQFGEVSFYVNDEQLRCLQTPEVRNTTLQTATGPALAVKKYLADALWRHMNALYQGIEGINADIFAASFGFFASTGNATPLTVNLLNAAQNALNVKGFADMALAMSDNGFDGRYILVGQQGQLAHRAQLMRGVAAANDAGVDFAKLQSITEYDFYKSQANFLTKFGSANSLVAYAPGAAQLVTFNEYAGDFAKMSETFAHLILPDPRTGLKFDLKVVYDAACDEKTKVFLRLNWTLWTAPTDLYKVGDRLAGVNGINEFTAAAA